MKNIKYQLSMAIVCIVLGLMITIQFRTVRANIGPISEFRARELASQLKRVKEERDYYLSMKNDYESKIREYENAASQGSYSTKMLKVELDNARIMAGLEDVEGPGLTVKVDDLGLGESNNYAFIKHSHLLLLLNDLNAAGAEAVSINDQRIISTTEIREAGNHININTVEFAPPFTFKVIGEPQTLEAALKMRGGIVAYLENEGLIITINKQQNVKISKYNGVIERKYATVIKEGETQ